MCAKKIDYGTIEVVVFGKASGRSWSLPIGAVDDGINLLQFLQRHGLPIASSCSGEGVCAKCVFNSDELSCQIMIHQVKEILRLQNKNKYLINFDYL